MLTNTLVALYASAVLPLMLLFLAQRITTRQFSGAMAILDTISAIVCAAAGWTSVLYQDVAGAALFGWMWWNSGGGDDTKRRLKSWAGRFEGVRRTAPAAS